MLEANYTYLEDNIKEKSHEQIWHIDFEASNEPPLFIEIPSMPNLIGRGWGLAQQTPNSETTSFSFKRSGDRPALVNHIIPAKMWFQLGSLHRLDDAAMVIGDQYGYFYQGSRIDPMELLGKRANHIKTH